MQIQVQLPNGKTIVIDVQLEKTTVQDVKKKVVDKAGVAMDELIIIFNQQILKNSLTLQQCGIEKEALLEALKPETLQSKFQQKLDCAKEDLADAKERYIHEQQAKEEAIQQCKSLNQKLNELENQNRQLILDMEQQKQQNEQLVKRQTLKDQELQSSSLKPQMSLQISRDDVKQLEIEIARLKVMTEKQDIERTDFNSQIEYLRKEKEQQSLKIEDLQKSRDELIEKKYEIKSLQKELELYKDKKNQTQDEISKDLEFSKQTNKQLEQQIQELKTKNQELELEKIKLEMKTQLDSQSQQNLMELASQNVNYEKRINEYKTQITSLSNQIKELQNINQDEMRKSIGAPGYASAEKMQSYERQISKITNEKQALDAAFEESQSQLSQYKKQVFEQNKKIKELETSLENLTYLIKDKERKIREKDEEIRLQKTDLDELRKDIQLYQTNRNAMRQIVAQVDPTKVIEVDTDTLKVDERLRQREEQRQRELYQQEQQKQRELEVRQEKLRSEQQQYQELMVKNKEQRQKTAQFLKKQMMESHGKIEVCFLLDVTGSMDPYKEQAMKCVRESMKNIKIKTNRDALWATVAYQDFGELKQLGGLYKQLNFTPKPNEIEDYLKEIQCAGGGDAAEDIRGGIFQMIKNLNWSKTFKIAILICDAPTHGKKYNGGVSDRYPNEDIQDAIELLIQNNIMLVAILFNKVTLQMFEEIKQIYKFNDREELLLFADLANTEEGRIWQELVDLVSAASQRATQTNNKGTKSKNAEANKRSQSGAMEALCKTIKDPFQFDKLPGISIVKSRFQVIRVEIKQDSFENNIENIKRLDLNRDYNVFQEGQWDCIRTEKQFAQGQMKQVFLMKRESNQNELYVIKMPLGDQTYKNQEAAITECRSHLISKCLMKKFVRELQEARDKYDRSLRFPEPQYSDFLILKDSNQSNSYWIAERFFSGEFVKYNNNYGFISDDNTDINHLAQAFSYYTYFISNFNYMVSDVQGVGNYFTDPALNTKDGNFDETDMGVDGQSMFMVSYEGKRQIGKKYLDLLNIN